MNFASSNSGQQPFRSFSAASNRYDVNPSQDFINSNSLLAKIAFLLMVLLGFVVVLRMGISLMTLIFTQSNDPRLISGMVEANQLVVITQDPSVSGAITVPRSVNATDGIEFTWSVWIYIDDLTYNAGKYRCVFYKGNSYATDVNASAEEQQEQQGLNFPNNAPGLYISPTTNNLVVFMNTFNVINEQVTIEDVPLNKWVNVIIRCQNTTLDIYVNGVIIKSHELHGVPKQNYGDVYVAANGGFDGNISDLWYYSYALGTTDIANLVRKGPDTTSSSDSFLTQQKDFDYLSMRWIFGGMNTDQMNGAANTSTPTTTS